jgi:hypothetical protein
MSHKSFQVLGVFRIWKLSGTSRFFWSSEEFLGLSEKNLKYQDVFKFSGVFKIQKHSVFRPMIYKIVTGSAHT